MGKRIRLLRGSSAGWLLSVFIITVMQVPAMAQVHIQEKVTITPGQANEVQDAATPVVTITPSEMSEGDTATIDVQWQSGYGPFVYDFEAGIVSGEKYGTLVTFYADTMDSSKYLWPVETVTSGSNQTYDFQLYYISYGNLDSDSVTVEIRVGVGSVGEWDSAHPGGKGNAGLAMTNGLSAPGAKRVSSAADSFQYSTYGVAWLTIKKKQTGPNLNFPRYSQGDPQWADSAYDHKGTIQENGCALSAMAWVLSAYDIIVNPLKLNDWMNGKPFTQGGYSGSLVNWNAINHYSGGELTAVETKTPAKQFGILAYSHDPSILDGYLDSGGLVMAEVENGGDTHWVVVEPAVNGDYPIIDPGYWNRTELSVYHSNFWSYVVVSKSNGK